MPTDPTETRADIAAYEIWHKIAHSAQAYRVRNIFLAGFAAGVAHVEAQAEADRTAQMTEEVRAKIDRIRRYHGG